jgi:DNA polymerase alpha subunit B
VMGRIALDAESSSEGSVKLNETSVVLESSRMMGSGARVPLRFEPSVKIRGVAKGSGNFGLFPGALVAVKGRNGGGGWFLVSELLAVSCPL